MKKKKLAMSEEEIRQIVLSDYDNARVYQTREMSKIYSWRRQYLGLPYGNEREGHTRVVSKDIRKFSEWSISTIVDPFVSTPDIVKCIPNHPSSVVQAEVAEMILNTQFCSQFNRFDFLTKAIKILDIEGTVVIKTGWEYAEEERIVKRIEQVPAISENTGVPKIDPTTHLPLMREQEVYEKMVIPVSNHPTAMVCRNDDIIMDPTALGDIRNCNFIIHRFATNMSALRVEGKYKNLDALENVLAGSTIGDAEYIRDENFGFMDDPRKRVIIYEYWGNIDINGDGIVEPVVVTFSNNIILDISENPMPDKKPPFIICPFMPQPFKFYGESNVENLDYIQKIKTAILRGMTDSMARANSGQVGIRKGALDEVNKRRFYNGENFEFNGTPNDIYNAQFNPIASSTFSMLDVMNMEAEGLTGLSAIGNRQFTRGLQETSTNSTGILDAGNLRKLQIVRNVAENLVKPLLRKWLAYDFELLGENSQIRLTDGRFLTVNPEDIKGEMDIGLTISTNEDNLIKAQELSFLLQTIGPSGDPYVNKRLMIEIAKLHKMTDLAQSIENYEPQPDPYEQAIKELEIQRLQAEIQNLSADSGRLQVDAHLKEAKANTEMAKTRNLSGKADLDSLKYYNDRNNITHQRELEKLSAKSEYDKELQKTKNSGQLLSALMKHDKIDNRKTDMSKPNIGAPFYDVGQEQYTDREKTNKNGSSQGGDKNKEK